MLNGLCGRVWHLDLLIIKTTSNSIFHACEVNIEAIYFHYFAVCEHRAKSLSSMLYFFSQGYSLKLFLIFAHLWWFGVLGLGSYWVFGVGVFIWWGLGPVVWGLLGFLGLGSLYKHKRITLGKKMVRQAYILSLFIWSIITCIILSLFISI